MFAGEPVTCTGRFVFPALDVTCRSGQQQRSGSGPRPVLHAAGSFGAVTHILFTLSSLLPAKPVIPGHMEPIAFVFVRCYHKASGLEEEEEAALSVRGCRVTVSLGCPPLC